ncbi:GntR family transcriptional regulator [bacterium]|nr:MAG: GntR family transcriptional regulator [bacterium]
MTGQPSLDILEQIVQAESTHSGPLHAQLKRALRVAIDDHFENGQRFWPETELISRLGMSQNTVRRALGDLAQEGVLERQVAKGSFVRKVVTPITTTVGALVPQHDSEVLNYWIEELSGTCRERGYRFQVYPTHRGEDVQEILQHLDTESTCKRFILLGNPLEATCELWDGLTARGCRTVCISTPAQGRPANYVGMDDVAATRLSLEFLRDLGHQRITYISNEPSAHPSVIAREAAFRQATKDFGLTQTQVVSCGTRHWEDAGKAVLRVMQQVWEQRPTALLTTSDVGAWCAMNWLSENGISVPQDISVLSFDNSYTSQFTSPPLTCISQSRAGLAHWVIELLDSPSQQSQQILQKPEIIQRRSVGPAPR